VRYEFSLDRALPAAPGDPERTHFGGVGTNLRIDGDSGFGRQDEPTRLAGVAIWGIGAVTREGRLVGEYPLRLIVGSRTRTADTGRALGGTDATRREVDQIDLWISSDRGVEASTASTGERTLPAGQPREAEGAVGPLPAFHVVWAHANVKFKPF
ncbi:MAG TPA: hypothetical protein VHF22_05405, partial [Planctomycetota bacterium]|nr:hypothetical protein [Planctomycetota bacterium]